MTVDAFAALPEQYEAKRLLTAALAQGVGLRTADERLDFLMQDAPDDRTPPATAVFHPSV